MFCFNLKRDFRMLTSKERAEVWQFYRQRRAKVRSHKPNQAHKALLALSERTNNPKDFFVVTQNVDHYEIDAGLDPRRVVQIHGDILTTRCYNEKCNYQTRVTDTSSNDSETRCPKCNENLRPDVVWFDEDFRPGDEEQVKAFIAQGPCDVVFVIGTSATFSYIADWALTAVKPTGWLIEINPKPSDIGRFAHQIYRGKVGRVLPKLLKQLSKGEPPKRLLRHVSVGQQANLTK
jgi:NAD-dependent deacetylase